MVKHYLLISFLLIFSCSATSSPIKIICTTDNTKSSLHVVALKKFAELITKYSNNRLEAEIHFRGNENFPAILGEEDNMTMVMNSHQRIHITVLASGNASLQASILEFLMLPYIFRDTESAIRLFKSSFMINDVNAVLANRHNVRAIGWLIGGFRHLTTSTKPVRTLQDLKGMSIRTPRNRLMRDTYIALGADVVPLNWSDTFSALESGVVEGQENPYSVIVDSKFWNAKQKYVTNNGPFLWVGPILINEQFFQALPRDLQQVVLKAGKEASEFEWQWQHDRTNTFKDILLSQNMQILDLQDKSEWVSVTQPLWHKYYKYIGYGDPAQGEETLNKVLKITNARVKSPLF